MSKVTKATLKKWMRSNFESQDFDHYDLSTEEVNLTRLVENCAHHGPGDDWMLDESNHSIWDAAVEVADEIHGEPKWFISGGVL